MMWERLWGLTGNPRLITVFRGFLSSQLAIYIPTATILMSTQDCSGEKEFSAMKSVLLHIATGHFACAPDLSPCCLRETRKGTCPADRRKSEFQTGRKPRYSVGNGTIDEIVVWYANRGGCFSKKVRDKSFLKGEINEKEIYSGISSHFSGRLFNVQARPAQSATGNVVEPNNENMNCTRLMAELDCLSAREYGLRTALMPERLHLARTASFIGLNRARATELESELVEMRREKGRVLQALETKECQLPSFK